MRRELLRHLVQSRYAAASAGGPAWALRTFDQVHEVAGRASAPTTDYTRQALKALESLGLVETVAGIEGITNWRATPAGVRAMDQSHECAEKRAA